MNSHGTVSVLMPIYNAEKHLQLAVESVFAQTEGNLELIAVDDGSTDRSGKLLDELASRAPFRVHVEHQANSGPSRALHKALGYATGEWICWLAADDMYAPTFVERNLREASALGGGDFVLHSNAYLIEDDGALTGTLSENSTTEPLQGNAFELWLSGNGYMAMSTMFIRKELLQRAGGFNPHMYAEDLDLRLRLTRVAPFHYIEDPIYYLRHTPGSLGRRPWLWGEDAVNAITAHADIIGDRLPSLLSNVSENLSASCLEHGSAKHSFYWGRRAIDYMPGTAPKAKVAARLIARSSRALARATAHRLFGRSALVRLKRALQRI